MMTMGKYIKPALLIALILIMTFYAFSINRQLPERVIYLQEFQDISAIDRIIDYQRYNCDSVKRFKFTYT